MIKILGFMAGPFQSKSGAVVISKSDDVTNSN